MARPKIPDGLRRRNLLDLVVVALVIGTSELLGLIPEEHGLLGPLSRRMNFINADPYLRHQENFLTISVL